jgi:sortase A
MQAVILALVLSLTTPSIHPAANTPTRARVDAPTQQLGIVTGRVQIPAIGVDEVIREGVDLSVINQGVAHWSGTADAGGIGNMVLAGHRTIHTAPFRNLDKLQPGDEILVSRIDGLAATYRVVETLIVQPEDMWIVDTTDVPTLTLFACHPKGSSRQRIVIRAELVDAPVVVFP